MFWAAAAKQSRFNCKQKLSIVLQHSKHYNILSLSLSSTYKSWGDAAKQSYKWTSTESASNFESNSTKSETIDSICDSIAAQLHFSLSIALSYSILYYILLAFATALSLSSPVILPLRALSLILPAIVRLPLPPVRVVPSLTLVAITIPSRASLEKKPMNKLFQIQLSSLSLSKFLSISLSLFLCGSERAIGGQQTNFADIWHS